MFEKWFIVYKNLADELAKFYFVDRSGAARRFAELCLRNPHFVRENNWMKRAIVNTNDPYIDPVQIFASISDPSAKSKLRTRRINLLFELLGSPQKFDNINFEGCPTLFTIKVMARRTRAAQAEIWALLYNITTNGRNGLDDKVFGNMKSWYGINITSLTVFLFWLDAENFMPMDENTVRYLRATGKIKSRPKNYQEYQSVLNNSEIQNYPQVSIDAKQNNALEIVNQTTSSDVEKQRIKKVDKILEEEKSQISGCRILGLRVYKKTPIKWLKVLTPGKIYNFYKAFAFTEHLRSFKESNDNEINYDEFRDVPLYQEGQLNVHISAIVGENGSGKSTLTELLFIIINNFTINFSSIPNKLIVEKGIYADLFFITDALYKLSIQDDLYLLKKYSRTDSGFAFPEDVTSLEFDFEQFFYSIVTNYALYALNSESLGEWVAKLFHKNDQYQAPIVINPFRKKGNININSENDLVKSRLVANLLLPVDEAKRKNDTIRKLTNNKLAEQFLINLNKSKFDDLYKIDDKAFGFELVLNYWSDVLKAIKDGFDIKQPLPLTFPTEPRDYIEAAWMYLMKKIISICITYTDFNIFYNRQKNLFYTDKLDDLIIELRRQTSHVTHKFYQTIHFLNYNYLSELRDFPINDERIPYDINLLSEEIEKIVINLSNKKFKTVHFAPPAFLDVQIELSRGVDFNDLSSGEKQRIYSVSSVAYHLTNLDSNVDQEELIRYNNVNILFDEVELYFHPEMQRTFIKFLLDYIRKLELEFINSLNFIFVTHSPFILSDVPSDNIIFLGETTPSIKTFGSNIHTLLSESFFLKESFMGDYAKEKINDLIKFLLSKKSTSKWTIEIAQKVISIIGEPLLKDRLQEIFNKKFEKQRTVDNRLEDLYRQIEILEHEKNKK